MVINSGIITFTGSAEEELAALSAEMRLRKILLALQTQEMPSETKADLYHLLLVLADLFSASLPSVEDDPMDTLRAASRDMNLGRLLRERGIFRVYRLSKMQAVVEDPEERTLQIPFYALQPNPDTGRHFTSREEFLIWFCREAHIPRSLIFQRLAAIDKLIDLGIDLEEAFTIILSKPYAIQETLNLVAAWDKGELCGVHPAIAERLATKLLPEQVSTVSLLAEQIQDEDDPDERQKLQDRLKETVRPAIAGLIREVAAHPSVRDVLEYVRHDLVSRPEVRYFWDYSQDCPVIEFTRKSVDPHGTEYISQIQTFPLVPDIPALPDEVRCDLMKRLPIRNREKLDN
jgi:hypothetical protein